VTAAMASASLRMEIAPPSRFVRSSVVRRGDGAIGDFAYGNVEDQHCACESRPS
jgi:hypothetical protein